MQGPAKLQEHTVWSGLAYGGHQDERGGELISDP